MPCPALAPSRACKSPQEFMAWPPNDTSPCSGCAKLCSLLSTAYSNPHLMAARVFGDLPPLLLQKKEYSPSFLETSPCSHWSFAADVKEGKLRPLIVFVGGNLVIAFWLLLTPSSCAGAAVSLGGLGGRRGRSGWPRPSLGCKDRPRSSWWSVWLWSKCSKSKQNGGYKGKKT